jgi:hypothetical protein
MAIALVLATLALVQACGDSSKGTGPSSGSTVQLKLRQVSGAELPATCNGVYSVSGPGVNIVNKALPESGKISFQGTLGQTYFVSVQLACGFALVSKLSVAETLSGSTSITLVPGTNEATITLQVSKVLSLNCASPVDPGQTSKCTCSVQSPGPASIGWQGATPSGPNTANFVNDTPGTYPVTCTVNAVAVATTSVTVKTPEPVTKAPEPVTNTITVTVENFPLLQQRRGLPQNRISLAQGCCPFFVRFVGHVGTTQISRDETRSFQVPSGTLFQASCTTSFTRGLLDEETVTKSKTIVLDGASCG